MGFPAKPSKEEFFEYVFIINVRSFAQVDDCRRRHNYDPFVSTFLTMLAEQGHLARLLEEQNTVIRRVSTSSGSLKGGSTSKKENSKRKKKIKKVIKK